ncbi:hypothetical protein L596_024158 [Steinernema carpocapsae]|uniref:C3H1-type domain-containing protein n=1 Tax=Steinernema carpocapsae TaxID=34508 RepID=A0A4U5MFX2_STECR|nr:hypothetical protein L596_024158 [Steinernema carpocapsae]
MKSPCSPLGQFGAVELKQGESGGWRSPSHTPKSVLSDVSPRKRLQAIPLGYDEAKRKLEREAALADFASLKSDKAESGSDDAFEALSDFSHCSIQQSLRPRCAGGNPKILNVPLTAWHALSDEERAEVNNNKRRVGAYKTALCKTFKTQGCCPYENNCRFAHGEVELRLGTQRHHPNYKTQLCNKFSVTGICPYGSRCQFIHRRLVTTPRPEIPGSENRESSRGYIFPVGNGVRPRAPSTPVDPFEAYFGSFQSTMTPSTPAGLFSHTNPAIPPNPFNPLSRPSVDVTFTSNGIALDNPSSFSWRGAGNSAGEPEFMEPFSPEHIDFALRRRI